MICKMRAPSAMSELKEDGLPSSASDAKKKRERIDGFTELPEKIRVISKVGSGKSLLVLPCTFFYDLHFGA